MANKQKISEIVINNVLAFITPFAGKRLKKAIELLLKPCCEVIISDASYDCDLEQFTITLSPAQTSIGSLGAFVDVATDQGTGDYVSVGTGTLSTDGKTVVVDVPLADAPVGASQVFRATIQMPSGTSNSPGVYILAFSADTTIPSC